MLFFPDCSTVIRGAPRLVACAPGLVVGAPRCTWWPLHRSSELWDLTTLGFWSDNSQTLPEAPCDKNTFCWCCWRLSIVSAYVNGSLLKDIDARAIVMMISAFAEISTGLLVIRFMPGVGGWHDSLVMETALQSWSFSQRRYRSSTTDSLDTGGASVASGGRDLTPVLAWRVWRLSAPGRLWSVSLSVRWWLPLPWPSPVRLVRAWSWRRPSPTISISSTRSVSSGCSNSSVSVMCRHKAWAFFLSLKMTSDCDLTPCNAVSHIL